MKIKSAAKKISFCLLLLLLYGTALYAETITMRVVAANPSKDKTQTTSVKSFLPKEIALKDVKDSGGLEIEYDDAQGAYYAYKDAVELKPGEVKVFELILDDVWRVAEEKIEEVRSRTDGLNEKFKTTAYANQADAIAKSILTRLDEILRTQSDQNVTKKQHIAYHRNNMAMLEAIMKDIDKLEKLLVQVGGPPVPEMVEKSDINLKHPTSKTTWIIIFIILVFIAILGGSFYFIWMGQAKITENIFNKEKDVSYSDFKKKDDASGGPPEDEKKA